MNMNDVVEKPSLMDLMLAILSVLCVAWTLVMTIIFIHMGLIGTMPVFETIIYVILSWTALWILLTILAFLR